jgi:Ca2+-binding RTX toxin-like protein
MTNQTGDGKRNKLNGSDHDDVIKGMVGNDVIHGMGGNDKIYGGDDNDLLFGDTGTNTVFGEAGDDQVVLWTGHDIIDGGSGTDLLDFYNTKGIKIDLADSHISFHVKTVASSATFKNMEGLYGSRYSDRITGDDKDNRLFSEAGSDTVHGGDGDDVINGYIGNDKLFGDAGDDIIIAASGKDQVDGGDGSDWLDFYYTKGVTVSLEKGSVKFRQLAGKALMEFESIENLHGSRHKDSLTGDDGANSLNGLDGNDTLVGLGGNDIFDGREGKDILKGGAGRDSFLFDIAPDAETNFDKILDFESGTDRLAFDKSVFDVKGTGKAQEIGNTTFQSMRHEQFQTGAGHDAENADVRIIYDATDGILYYDSNGSKSGGLAEVADIGKNLDISADQIDVLWYH